MDTNLFVHAMDQSSPVHPRARTVYPRLMTERYQWVVADQTLFELYRALRNPAIFSKPLSTARAVDVVEQIRDRGAAAHCAYESRDWPHVMKLLRRVSDRKGLLILDAVVAVTLKTAGVSTFYTRNVQDFRAFRLFDVVDPTSES